MDNLAFRPAFELRALLSDRKLSSLELVDACIRQIERHNPVLNAMVTLDLDNARVAAKRADDAKDPLGLLHGLPVAVKDVFATAGLRTTYGNRLYEDNVPDADDIVVARERAAGAVVMGKSNTPDCASGGRTQNEIFGLTLNPWNHDKTTSGSGGGGVSALASGMSVLADGSDVGGSVRSPGGWTNLVGYRPSSGRIPAPPGSMADGGTSTAGVFARCVRDAALFQEAVDGPDPRCAIPFPRGSAVRHDGLDETPVDLPVAWLGKFGDLDVDEEITDQFQALKPVLPGQGMAVKDVDFDPGPNYRTLFPRFNGYAYVKGLPARVLENYKKGGETKYSIVNAMERYLSLSPLEIFEMFKARDELAVRTQAFMRDYPIVAQPMHCCLAFGAHDQDAEDKMDWSPLYQAPMLGLPSICVPAGFTRDGMPHGIMFTAPAGWDQELLRVAHAFERETRFGQALPPGIA